MSGMEVRQNSADEVVFNVKKRGGSKFKEKLESVTVEPILFLFMFGLGVNYPALHALLYKKVCIQRFSHNLTICDNLHEPDHKVYEDEVQTDASHWLLYEHLAFEIPSVLMSFFYGSLSDNVGRKMTLILPTIGQSISMANYIIQSVHMDAHVGYILIGRLISGVFGGWIGCCLTSFSYLSAVTSSENRTIRIALAEGCISISIAISFFLSGIILDSTSFEFVFGLACAVNILATVYVLVWIKEPPGHCGDTGGGGHSKAATVCSQMWIKVKDSVTCVFHKRPGNQRKHLLILLLALLLGMLSYNAMYTLGYLYLRRQPLSWSQTTYGILVGTRMLISGTCLFTVVPLLVKYFHLPDTALILLALVSSAVSEAFLGISTKTWMVFMLPILACMTDAKHTCIRAQLSQFVEPTEYGRMFAAVGFLQSISGIMGTLLYNNLYPLTLDIWPGLCFVLGAVITVVPIGLVSWLHFDLKKEVNFTELEEEIEETAYGSSSIGRSRGRGRRSSSKGDSNTENSPLKSSLQVFAIFNNSSDNTPDYRPRLRIPSAVF